MQGKGHCWLRSQPEQRPGGGKEQGTVSRHPCGWKPDRTGRRRALRSQAASRGDCGASAGHRQGVCALLCCRRHTRSTMCLWGLSLRRSQEKEIPLSQDWPSPRAPSKEAPQKGPGPKSLEMGRSTHSLHDSSLPFYSHTKSSPSFLPSSLPQSLPEASSQDLPYPGACCHSKPSEQEGPDSGQVRAEQEGSDHPQPQGYQLL